jgi:RNA polymerase sigma factor (sigma-70 family)
MSTMPLIAELRMTSSVSPFGDRAVPRLASDPASLESYLPTLRPIIRQVCARARCFGADADDFEQVVYLTFLERKILDKLGDASQPRAFLHVVVANLFRDFRIQRWGKWRPSAKASRLGDAAVTLERLVHQRKLSPGQAVEALATQQGATGSRAELEALVKQLPLRVGRHEVGEEGIDRLLEPASTDRFVVEQEKREQRRDFLAALEAALRELSPEDRSLLRLRFWEEVSVARLSVMTGTAQRSLYSHFDRLRAQLRRSLMAAGIVEADTQQLLAAWDGPLDQGDCLEP